MQMLAIYAQIIIALSIIFVWVVRFENIVKEFNYYKLPNIVRSVVGATKISLATLLIVGIWYPSLVLVPSLLMAALMLCAQLTHFKVKNKPSKYLPSLALLILSLFVAGVYSGTIS